MVTLKDIATNLNLSVMAVSKALRDAPDISESTKARVVSEANKLGYMPNRSARSLRAGFSQMIGCILPSLNHTQCAEILKGLEEESAAFDYDLLISSSDNSVETEVQAFRRMMQHKIDALFIFPAARVQHRSFIQEEAIRLGVPTVFMAQVPASVKMQPNFGWVVSDNYKAGQLATDYLINKGHQEILYLAGPLGSSSAAEHFSGYKKSLADAGLEFTDERVFLAGIDMKAGQEAMARAIDEAAQFTAVVSLLDSVAIGAMSFLRKQGVGIPEDVSFVGFGDSLEAEYLATPLTTVRTSKREIGKSSFRMWYQNRAHHDAKLSPISLGERVLPVELVERESVLVYNRELEVAAL
ncbi:MAG: LacI family DNA-binding transcriptional regulator [Verrucomicrobiota bacterium]